MHEYTLDHLPIGQCGQVVELSSRGKQRRRMLDLGLVQGVRVQALGSSPAGDPVAYDILGAVIALRRSDAHLVRIAAVR